MLKNHSMSSTRAFLLDRFLQTVKLLTIAFSSDGQVPLKQIKMDNPLHIPPDAQHFLARCGVSLMLKLPCLKRGNYFWAALLAKVFSVDSTNILGSLCSFGGIGNVYFSQLDTP
jgi:hypothetical protein